MITDNGAQSLAAALKENIVLNTLYLEHNEISPNAIRQIKGMIRKGLTLYFDDKDDDDGDDE